MEYYGARRKRHIDMSRFEDRRHSINWGEEPDLEEEYEDEDVNEYDSEPFNSESVVEEQIKEELIQEQQLMLNGKPFVLKEQQKKKSFAETHVRITTYLEINVHQIIKMLHNQGQIESITKLVNDSVKVYLEKVYSKE